MTAGKCGFAHLIGALWVGANVWYSWPMHRDGAVVVAVWWAMLLLHPAFFGATAWMGRKRRSIFVAIVCPALVVMAWFFVPALGVAYRWGWDSFMRFLLRTPAWYAWIYWALCGLIYVTCIMLARPPVNQEQPQS